MRGRPPVPSKLKVLRGTDQPCRMNKREPQAEAGAPACPAWLSPKAKRAWKEIVGILGGMKILAKADRKALEMLCDAYAEYRDARAVVSKQGATYEAETVAGGTMIRPRPEVAIAADAWRRVKGMLTEFGLTPASRSRVHVPEKGENKSPFAEFLSNG